VAAENGALCEVADDHRLADAVGPEQHCVDAFGDETEGEELVDSVLVDRLRPLPIEVGDRLEGADLCLGEAAFQAALLALDVLDLEELVEPGLLSNLSPMGEEAVQAEATGALSGVERVFRGVVITISHGQAPG